MKPLTDQQKEWAQDWLVRGPLRPVAHMALMAMLNLELATHALMSRTRAPDISLSDVTIVIKTFERPKRCQALIRSIRRLYPQLPIIVVDDSLHPARFEGVKNITLPFDSGVSAGRNAGLAAVQTPYFVNLDDDIIFYRKTLLSDALSLLQNHPEIDIMGGEVIDLPLYITHDFRCGMIHPTDALPVLPSGTRIGILEVHDKVASNIFIARTDSVRKVGWDPKVKRLDHADFYTRAKGRLTSVHNPELQALHVRNPFNAAYLDFRLDLEEDYAYLRRKYY